jgi:hypothetical protein
MFGRKTNEEEKQAELYAQKLSRIEDTYQRKIEQSDFDHRMEIDELNRKHALEIQDKDFALGHYVDSQVKLLETTITTLQKDNSVLEKEKEILTKAFENMGFDVKDMKSILDKLVDGLVSKNEISVIK